MTGGFGKSCPYGVQRTEVGPTRRARKFHTWINERRERYKHIPYLKGVKNKLAFIGEYVYLPYSFMSMNKEVFEKPSSFCLSGSCFLPVEQWNIATVESLISYRPQAMMGGVIRDYQREQVPMFIQHLREQARNLFDQLDVETQARAISPVGRKAYIATLREGAVFNIKDVEWTWSANAFTCKNGSSTFLPISGEVHTTIYPKDHEVIEVQSEDQVYELTEYLD